MIVLTSLVITAILLMIQGFFNASLSFNLELSLVAGLIVYFLANKKAGLIVIYAQAAVFDLIYTASLPINIIGITIVYLVWRLVIERNLVLLTFGPKLLSMMVLLIAYYVIHWFLAWLPYWFGDQIMYPNIYSWWTYLISLIINLVILVVLSLIVFFIKSRLHVER